MKIIVVHKISGGENVKFAVELPDEFGRYKPRFLTEYFAKAILDAVMDLRAPIFLTLIMQLNLSWWHMKCDLLKRVCSGPDMDALKKIMEKLDLDFIQPDGDSSNDGKTKKKKE